MGIKLEIIALHSGYETVPTTNTVLEERLAQMEGGISSLAVASGMEAINYAIQSIRGQIVII